MKRIIYFFADSKETILNAWEQYGEDAYILLKHCSWSIDNRAFIKEKGLLSLLELLDNPDSPVSKISSDAI